MKTIAKNDKYQILVDAPKNRLYLTITGYWESLSQVPNYLHDLEKATWDLKKDFTILSDVSQMKTPPEEVVALHVQAQRLVVDDGLKTTAEVVGKDVINQMAIDNFAKTSGMVKATFDNRHQAELWLDEQVS